MNPPQPSPPFRSRNSGFSLGKLAAVVCSVTLVGGYVMYRSGASIFPSTKSGRVWEEPPEQGVEPAQSGEKAAPQLGEQTRMLSSSKWGPVVTPTTEPARTVMPGSKVGLLMQPVEDIPRRVVMPGSKSSSIDLGAANVTYSDRPATQPGSQPSQPAPHP